MAAGRWYLCIVAGMTLAGIGCVDRRFVVESNIPGAQVTVDGKPIGPAPADAAFQYPGEYEFKAVAPGYQPLKQKVRFKAKWYDYPPLDFFAEVLWPGRIEDVRRVRLDLEPVQPVRTDELLSAANLLRSRGQSLPPSTVPDDAGPPPGTPSMPLPPLPTVRVLPPGPSLPSSSNYQPISQETPPPPSSKFLPD